MSYNSKYSGSEVDALLDKVNNGIPLATSSTNGGIKIGYTANNKNYPVVLDSNGKAYVNVPWLDLDTKYDVATQTSNGLMSSSDKSKLNVVFASTTATSVASLNANYQTIKVTLSANGTLSMSATGSSMNGRSVTAYILASGADRTVTIPTSGNYISMCGSSLTIPSGKWAELNMVCVDGIWHIAKMEQE